MLRSQLFYNCIISILLFCSLKTTAQTEKQFSIDAINNLIAKDSTSKALGAINTAINQLKKNKNFDSLPFYIYPLGKTFILKNDLEKAKTTSRDLLTFVENSNPISKTRYLANIEYSKLCLDLGNLPEALKHASLAKTLAYKLNDETLKLESEYYIADYGMKMGQIDVLDNHIRKAKNILKNNPKTSFKISARVYNLLGSLMYYHSKQDSAVYYFEKALKNIPSLDDNAENKMYLPAILKGNLALIKVNQAKLQEAKTLLEASIKFNKAFLDKEKNHPLTARVKRNFLIGYSTLNGIYFDLGDFKKSDVITNMALDYASKNFPENTQEYFIAALGVAQVKAEKKEFDNALFYLDKAKKSLEGIEGENYQLNAFLFDNYANVYYNLNKQKEAISYWEKSHENYKKSNPNAFDVNSLYSDMNLAIAYSKADEANKAISTIEAPYEYFSKTEGEKSFLTKAIMLTYSNVFLNLKRYEESLEWSNKCLNLYFENDTINGLNKIYFDDNKADIYIVNAKAKYYNQKTKDSTFLKSLLPNINKAIRAIEQRKTSLSSVKDINTLIENNNQIFEFAKKINLELYNKTKNPSYLEKTISLHESALYNRIRARLNSKPISFSNIPTEITNRENQLKNALNEEDNIELIIANNKAWNTFLDTLKNNYPKYYKMRYATIEQPLKNMYNKIPSKTSVVRYLYIDDGLYAFISSKSKKNIYKLDSKNILNYINQLGDNRLGLEDTSLGLYQLYTNLWKPFESEIATENVIIIPDRELFNLSFESLTPKKIKSFKELATNSLLAKYNIAYNYSLFLIDNNKNNIHFKSDFIAFAPEFNDKMKKDYKIAFTDSLSVDKTYLNLLPQPFSVDLAKKYSKLFNGSSFINEKASKQIFEKEAKEHKIIHIGTHAESNNITPELSRLIFAKDSSTKDNSLYTFEIYNENLNSNLAILTACETGKPTYQAGEGMISLAHAFNYAGSESILTSLWKIDEKSSAKLIELFYENIKKGLPKDKALKEAKLQYILEAQDRTVSPQYWAGLVLIGNTNPIVFTDSSYTLTYIIISGIILILVLIYVFKIKNIKF
ncbi:CHAT domain-containing protein [Confluentibacter sediminis]|uniref:CHAT domain-containing protein n=1 Tax=Confluentibacter sediminis TaxID=2219045 RepID=UPI000DAC51E6|nr:CHAT domain-containing protein [Confluentibacter sediminis]